MRQLTLSKRAVKLDLAARAPAWFGAVARMAMAGRLEATALSMLAVVLSCLVLTASHH